MLKGEIQDAVRSVVAGIVKHSDPDRIVLFGSAARVPSGTA
jgi:predicted nucleotidyltransferase